MEGLLAGIQAITWQMPVMWVIGGDPDLSGHRKGHGAYAASAHGLRRDPGESAPFQRHGGSCETLFSAGIANELFPLLLFIGIGAMIDFGPLLSNPQAAALRRGGAVRHFLHADRGPGSAASI